MAVTTTQILITGEWQQISDSDCTVQSVKAGTLYSVSIGIDAPTTDAIIKIRLDEPTTFAYKSPVWLRLNAKGGASMSSTINIIK